MEKYDYGHNLVWTYMKIIFFPQNNAWPGESYILQHLARGKIAAPSVDGSFNCIISRASFCIVI